MEFELIFGVLHDATGSVERLQRRPFQESCWTEAWRIAEWKIRCHVPADRRVSAHLKSGDAASCRTYEAELRGYLIDAECNAEFREREEATVTA